MSELIKVVDLQTIKTNPSGGQGKGSKPPKPESHTQTKAPSMNAFLSLGFRPLYIGGVAWSLVSIALWIFTPELLDGPMWGVAWHAHEMLWGFVITIAVAFLLTASATWTGHNPMEGKALGWLVVAWIVARVGYLIPADWAFYIAATAETIFFLFAAQRLMRVMMRSKNRRNDGLPFLVAGLGVINLLYLYEAYQDDYVALIERFNLGLVGMAIVALLVARRVLPFFAMRMVPGLEIPMLTRNGHIQLTISAIAILLGLFGFDVWMGYLLGVIGLMALYQTIRWKPWMVLGKPMLWILYLGYGLMAIGLIVAGLQLTGHFWVMLDRPATFVHLIGMGGFGALIIGMVTRTALGHTGRPLKLDNSMLISYYLVLVAVVFRLWALYPTEWYQTLLNISAATWIAGMALYLWRYVPLLIRPRPDK